MLLGCEARRCAAATRAEVAALIRHARGLHGDGKGERADYLERTVAAVCAAEPLAREGASSEDLGLALGSRWNLGDDDPIVGGELIGPGEDAIVRLERRSGAQLRFPSLRALFSARTHSRVVSVATGTRFPAVTEKEAVDLAQQVIQVCRKTEVDATDLTEEWLGNFYEGAGEVVEARMETTEERRSALTLRRAAEAGLDQRGNVAARTAVILDQNGDVWIPSGALRASLSPGAPGWRELEAAVEEVGWRRVKVELWPKPGRSDRGKRIKVVFYVGQP